MDVRLIQGDALASLQKLESGSIRCCVTSPPYFGLRDYGVAGQIGLEGSPEAYVAKLVEVFREVKRVLREDASLWINLGDSYGSGEVGRHDGGGPGRTMGKLFTRQQRPAASHKNLLGMPWRVAFALQADGWILRSDIIWHKPNPMPESVRDRPTKAHEYLFLLAKSERYYYDGEAIKEASVDREILNGRRPRQHHALAQADPNGFGRTRVGFLNSHANQDGVLYLTRNRRTVWTIATQPYKGAHFATFPEKLVEPCILGGCPEGGVVLDPFAGASTVGVVCQRLNRRFVGIELNPAYMAMSRQRLRQAKKKQRKVVCAA
jgi:DNA modification methylase